MIEGKMDRLRAYEVFVTVVTRGSFIGAAEMLNTSPANVTRYINELEAYLGTRLLNRTSRRLSLTESGEAVLERSRSLLAAPAYVARRGVPEKPADLAFHDCITYAYNADEWRFRAKDGTVHPVKVTGPMHANNGDTVRAALLAGLGIGWQPSFLIGRDLRE